VNDNVALFIGRHPITDQRLRMRLLEHQVQVLAHALRALAGECTDPAVAKQIDRLLHDYRL
jgi:hypothetical protein